MLSTGYYQIRRMRCSSVLIKLSFLLIWIILTENWYCSCQHWKCYTLSSENIYNTDSSVELSLFLQYFHDSAHKCTCKDKKIDQEELIPFQLRFFCNVAYDIPRIMVKDINFTMSYVPVSFRLSFLVWLWMWSFRPKFAYS